MLEKPIALELWEADELIALAKRNNLKFTIGYSQRFNPKIAYAKKKIGDGTLGNVGLRAGQPAYLARASARRSPAACKLSPAVMESTHDLDFVFWLLEPAKPVRVYSQGDYGSMQRGQRVARRACGPRSPWTAACVVVIGGGWNLPPSYPNFCSTWIEIIGTEGALILDDTHRDNWLNTGGAGSEFPMSTMPGEQVDHVFAGRHGAGDDPLPRSRASRPARDGDAGERAHGDGDLHRGRPVRRHRRAGQSAAVQRIDSAVADFKKKIRAGSRRRRQ